MTVTSNVTVSPRATLIEAGRKADLVVVDLRSPFVAPVHRLAARVQAWGTARPVGAIAAVVLAGFLIKNPNLDLLPGTNITARIESQVVPNAITIPKEAVFREDGKIGVYILTGDKLEWRTVTLGVNNVTRTEVKELKEGDKIAIPGDRPFTTGMQVRPAQQQ